MKIEDRRRQGKKTEEDKTKERNTEKENYKAQANAILSVSVSHF